LICPAFRCGAYGFLLKSTPVSQVMEAARALYGGDAPMSPEISRRLLDAFQHTMKTPHQETRLSVREKEILLLLAEGLQYKEIADQLYISPHTVRQHLHNVYTKLHVQNKTEAINKGLTPGG
jgi:DNA-binding NarL/FixJ family response regulator